MQHVRPLTRLLVLFAIGLVAAFLAKGSQFAWIWLGGTATAVMIGASFLASTPARRALWFNVAFGLAIATAIESYYTWIAVRSARDTAALRHENPYDTRPHAALGYSLTPSTERDATKWHGSDVVYRAHYTHGPDGLRVPFRATSNERSHAVLFFGGSYTYGEGVNDEETLPFATGAALDGEFAVYNFGVNGWGPQQMLAAIEHGVVAETLRDNPRFAIYMGIHHHLDRAAGRAQWLDTGPHYVLDGSSVVPAPRISARPKRPPWLWRQLEKSHAFQRARTLDRFVAQRDVDLYAAIVAASQAALVERYPGLEFHVLFWDVPGSRLSPRILGAFESAGLRTHRASEILPDYKEVSEPSSPYRLALHDMHPNPRAFRLLADYVATRIVSRE